MARMTRSTLVLLAAGLMAPLAAALVPRAHGQEAHSLPAPSTDETATAQPETTVLAGGCFWGVQGVFQHVRGVTSAVSGYTGGDASTAQYETVSTGATGHAESVKITYDPRQITYGRLLQIYFAVAHDPTELNGQGPDSGTQYRSALFVQTPEQARIARAYITQLTAAHSFSAPIVTSIEPGRTFYPAEGYHQNYLALNPDYPYIAINDMPKVQNLKRVFPDAYQPKPVLVPTSG